MTRQKLLDKINQALADYQLDLDNCTDSVNAAIDVTLHYLQEYVQDVSLQMVQDDLYGEAMVAGLIANQIKSLISND